MVARSGMDLRRMAEWRRFVWRAATLTGLLLLGVPALAHASSSTSYQIQEDSVGGVGGSYSTSTSYQSLDSAGVPAVGDSSSTTYRTSSGATTTNDPNLSFAVNTSSVSLGTLSTSTTGTGTATFDVLNYTSYGYVVQIFGNTPAYGAYNLSALTTPTASSTNAEQFGINLVSNTSPTTFGSHPQQVPDSTFSFGAAASNYNTTNLFKYVSGDTIAQATQSSGKTTYTISYIANITGTTPAGVYSGAETLICTGTY